MIKQMMPFLTFPRTCVMQTPQGELQILGVLHHSNNKKGRGQAYTAELHQSEHRPPLLSSLSTTALLSPQGSYDTHTPLKNILQQGRHMQQHAFKAPAPPSGLPRKTSNSAVRRTDSYLGSMGRRTDGLVERVIPPSNLVVKRDRVSPNKNNDKTTGESASSMVTLV